MQQIMALVICLLLAIFTFIPGAYLTNTINNYESIKQTLNLSARALGNCVQVQDLNFQELSRGSARSELSIIEVDKDLLLREFYDVLEKNIADPEKIDFVKSRLFIKVLVYYDRFYVADRNDRWSPPYFFTEDSSGQTVYVNSKNSDAYYYDAYGNKIDTALSNIGLTDRQKSELIIQKINTVVSQKTGEILERNGLQIEIYNPYNDDPNYKVKHSYFNVLDGLTYFVVFAADTRVQIHSGEFKFRNYNVVGYTLK